MTPAPRLAHCAEVLPGLAPGPGTARTVTFRQGPAGVTLRVDRPGLLEEVGDALHCYLRQAAPAAWTVTVNSTAPVDATAAAARFAAGESRDVGPATTALRITAGGQQAHWVPTFDTVVHVDNERHAVCVHCPDLARARHWAVRLTRQVMTAQLLDVGAVYSHAAAFVHHDTAVLIAGHKGAGKTTTLLTAVGMLGARFVANDRILLQRHDGEQIIGRAWPAPVRATEQTLRALPGLSHLTAVGRSERSASGKVVIEPQRLPGLCGAPVFNHPIIPRVLLLPYRSARPADPVVVNARQATMLLNTTTLFMHDPARGPAAHVNHWLIAPPSARVLSTNVDMVARALAASAVCWKVAVPDDPHHLATALRRILPTATGSRQ